MVKANDEAAATAAAESAVPGVAGMNAYVGAAEKLEKLIHEHSGSKV